MESTLIITRSRKMPVTTYLNSSGVIPHRVVSYRVVKTLRINVGCSLGLQYGVISLNGSKRIVQRSKRDNGEYSQWELI